MAWPLFLINRRKGLDEIRMRFVVFCRFVIFFLHYLCFQWLSPEGCLMFSLQLHIPLSSPLGQRVPLIQHLIVVGIVNGILNIEGYEVSHLLFIYFFWVLGQFGHLV